MPDLYAPVSSLDRLNLLNGSFRDSSFGFFVTDESGLLQYLNDEAARIFGFDSINEALEYSIHDFEMNVNCGLSEVFDTILKGKSYQKNEHRCTNRLGHYAVLNISLSPFRGEAGGVSGIVGTILDVTESYRKKVMLEEANHVLSVISQVSEALTSAAELNDVLRIILTGVTANQGLGFNRAFLLLINEKKIWPVGIEHSWNCLMIIAKVKGIPGLPYHPESRNGKYLWIKLTSLWTRWNPAQE